MYRLLEARDDLFFRIGSATSQALFKHFHRGWLDKDHDALRHRFLDLSCPRDIDIEKYLVPFFDGLVDGCAWSTVALRMDRCPLKKTIRADKVVELRFVDKIVIDTLGFIGSWFTCRYRHGVPTVIDVIEHFLEDGAFTYS